MAASCALVAAIGAAIWLFLRVSSAKLAPIALLLVGFCLELYFAVEQPYLSLGLQIYPNDVITIFVLGMTMAAFVARPVPLFDTVYLLWLGFGLVMLASFFLGAYEHGRYAGTEARPFFYVWSAGLYCATVGFSESELRRMATWCIRTAYAVFGIALYYWVAVAVGFVNRQQVFKEPDSLIFRPVGAGAALFVAMVGLVQTMAWLRGTGSRFAGLRAAAMLAFVIVIGHRTVWIAAAIGLACVFFLERRQLPKRFGLLLAFGLALTVGLAVGVALGSLDDLGRRLQESFDTMAQADGTFAARVDGWVRLMDEWLESSPAVWLFGFPFGAGFTRMHFGRLVSWDPHNFYLHLLLRTGIVGALLFVLSSFWAIGHGLRAKCDSEVEYLATRGLAVVLLTTLVVLIAYRTHALAGAGTGVALSEMIRRRRLTAGNELGSSSAAPTPWALVRSTTADRQARCPRTEGHRRECSPVAPGHPR
ncbi:MAG: O-antigen ligase family protein [Rubrivivax sp.]